MTTAQEEIKSVEAAVPETALSAEEVLLLQEMAEAGLLYGLNKSKTHPKMRPYIFATRSGVEIINLELSIKLITKTAEFLKSVTSSGKKVLIVGTSPSCKFAVKEFAEKVGMPYVNERWLGGTATNFRAISERIRYYNKLIADRESGALQKYTKKERIMIDKKIEKMSLLFKGISTMSELPSAILVLDPEVNKNAVAEAKELKIPVIGLANTDLDPKFVNYVITGNNRLTPSIAWVLNHLEASFTKVV